MRKAQRFWNTLGNTALHYAGAVLALTLATGARADSSDIQNYYVAKEHKFAQTSAAPSIEAMNPWQFTAEIQPTSGTDASSSSVQSPTLTLPDTTNTPFAYNSGRNTWRVRLSFPDKSSFDSSFPNGTYTFSMPTITPPATTFNATLIMTADAYPNTVPSLTNTSWSGGSLAIDPTQSFTFTWNAFSGAPPDAFIVLSIAGMPDQRLAATATSFTLPASSLPPGQLVSSNKLNFINPTFIDTTSVPGVTGLGGYITSDIFDIQTVVQGSPLITSPLVATGTVGLPFTYQFEASGATSLGVSNLPPGLTFDTSLKAITGIPPTAGILQVGLSAINSNGTTNATLALTVQAAPAGLVIINSTGATGRTGRAFSFQLQTKGGSSATRFAVDGLLPPGLNLDSSTGFISGTPTSDGSFGLAVAAIDGAVTANATLQLTFTSDPAIPTITSANNAILTPGQPFSYTITADANGTFGYIGSDGIVHQAPSPSCVGLPTGLCFDGDHTISGTFNPPLGSDRKSPARPDQTGGIITNVQLFAANPPNGTSIISLFPLQPASGATNIATRLAVGTGENVLIGGFIIAESVAGSGGPKKVVIRAIGPSLTQFGVPNALQDSTLELRDGAGSLLGSNDNWRDAQGQANQIVAARLQPTDDREAAILAYLNPGQYTAVVRGKNNSTGNALVEVYDLGTVLVTETSNSKLANIATRGTVGSGDDVMIGGVIIVGPNTRVVVRAIGPSLTPFGISGALQDPTLELRDENGVIRRANDDWGQGQPAEIQQAGLAPSDSRESALIETLQAGNYTATVSGKGGATGVAVVQGYALPP